MDFNEEGIDMNKVTNKSLDYAAKVQYNKYIKLKHARDKYMKNRSARNFDEVKRLSEDFDRFNEIYMNRLRSCNVSRNKRNRDW